MNRTEFTNRLTELLNTVNEDIEYDNQNMFIQHKRNYVGVLFLGDQKVYTFEHEYEDVEVNEMPYSEITNVDIVDEGYSSLYLKISGKDIDSSIGIFSFEKM